VILSSDWNCVDLAVELVAELDCRLVVGSMFGGCLGLG